MALQTKTFTWGSYAWKSESNAYVLELTLTENSISVTNNTSSVSYTLILRSGIQNRFQCDVKSTLKLNGVLVDSNTENKYLDYSSSWTLLSGTTTVTHKNDGSLNMPIEVSIDTTDSNQWAPPDKTLNWIWDLTTIPRESSFCTITGDTIGSQMTVNINRHNSAFTHRIYYRLDNSEWYTASLSAGTSATFTISNDLLPYVPNSTSATLVLLLRTFNGSTQIGGDVQKRITVYVDSSVVPSLGDINLDLEKITTTDGKIQNVLVQGKNTITVTISNATAGTGSSIKSYTYSVLSGSTVIETKSTTSTSVTFGPFSNVGTLKFMISITDNRDRTTSNSGSELTYTCYEYYAPSFKAFNAYRANQDATKNINGSYLMCDYNIDYAEVNNTNNTAIELVYVVGNHVETTQISNLPIDLGNTTSSYKVYAVITDLYGGKSQSATISVFGESRVFNITSDGTGVAIGKMADENEVFECRWPAKFNNSIDCSGVTINNTSIFDLIYPIGSIYMSMNNTNPSVIFGGTWEQIQDTFLLAASDAYEVGSTGGEAETTLETNHMPSHSHDRGTMNITGTLSINDDSDNAGVDASMTGDGAIEGTNGSGWGSNVSTDAGNGAWGIGTGFTFDASKSWTGRTSEEGGAQPHNNMPPYLAVYMWKRTG